MTVEVAEDVFLGEGLHYSFHGRERDDEAPVLVAVLKDQAFGQIGRNGIHDVLDVDTSKGFLIGVVRDEGITTVVPDCSLDRLFTRPVVQLSEYAVSHNAQVDVRNLDARPLVVVKQRGVGIDHNVNSQLVSHADNDRQYAGGRQVTLDKCRLSA